MGDAGLAPIDSKLAYRVWLQLISDEELYSALIDGSYRSAGAKRGLTEDELVVLDRFKAEPGTRWNIENLRFRSALEVADTLRSYLPRTMHLLTLKDEHWLQEISFEYLAFYRWQELGHLRLAECERFGTYVRERIMKRRIPPAHLESVLEFELAVVRLLKSTANVAADRWPQPGRLGDVELARAHLRHAPAVKILDLPVNILEWITSGDPTKGTVLQEPLTLLIDVPSLRETHRIKVLAEGARAVLDACDGRRTAAVMAAELEDELGLPTADVLALVNNWLDQRILVSSDS